MKFFLDGHEHDARGKCFDYDNIIVIGFNKFLEITFILVNSSKYFHLPMFTNNIFDN